MSTNSAVRDSILQQLVKRSDGGVDSRTVQQRFTAAAALGGLLILSSGRRLVVRRDAQTVFIMLPLQRVTVAPGIFQLATFVLLVSQFLKYGKNK